MSISLSTYQAVLIFLFLGITIVGLIIFLHRRIHSFTPIKRQNISWKDTFTQYPEVVFYRWRGTVLRFGFLVALCFTLVSFAITKKEHNTFSMEITPLLEDTVKIIRTSFPKEKLQKFEEVKIDKVDKLISQKEPTFMDPDQLLKSAIDSLLTSSVPIDTTEIGVNDFPAFVKKKLPEPPRIEDSEPPIVMFAEDNPRFPGCENLSISKKEKEKCAERKMLEFIYDHLRYPDIAKDNNIEGRVILQFIVNQYGVVENIEVVRGIGFGCDEAAKRVVNKMNELPTNWTPGRQMGRTVKVKFTLPITFQLK